MYKVYQEGIYLYFIVVATGELFDVRLDHAEIRKLNIDSQSYTFIDQQKIYQRNIALSNIVDKAGNPYTYEAFEAFRTQIGEAQGQEFGTDFTEATEDGTLPSGKAGISVIFRGSGGTLNGVIVPDGYNSAWSKESPNTVAPMTFTVPTDGEQRILIQTVD